MCVLKSSENLCVSLNKHQRVRNMYSNSDDWAIRNVYFWFKYNLGRKYSKLLRTPSSTRPGFEILTSRSWRFYQSAMLNHELHNKLILHNSQVRQSNESIWVRFKCQHWVSPQYANSQNNPFNLNTPTPHPTPTHTHTHTYTHHHTHTHAHTHTHTHTHAERERKRKRNAHTNTLVNAAVE